MQTPPDNEPAEPATGMIGNPPPAGTPADGPTSVWGLPLWPLTAAETLRRIDELVRSGGPHFVITANLNHAMLSAGNPHMAAANRLASLVVADGMPLVWASRWRARPLPERVAGSSLTPEICRLAAERGYRVFFLGGAPGVGEEAVRRLRERFPALEVAGIESPPFRELTDGEESELHGRIRSARPDVLFVAFGSPKGEVWLAEHWRGLGVPVCVQIGAGLDFLAGRVPRAPRWMQRTGLEWVYRLWREPGRLAGRYARNAAFALRMIGRDILRRRERRD
jgi:N-acetylglucosaminyldiphosphoundecaprenol N-acetyl-beta-D-mannosaminyltransferase